jgi:hypothetical protein
MLLFSEECLVAASDSKLLPSDRHPLINGSIMPPCGNLKGRHMFDALAGA